MDLFLEEVTLSQHASLAALYDLYKANFPLPEEQETFANFRRCLALNEDARLQDEYGPYREIYLAVRDRTKNGLICGGVIFGITTSRHHIADGVKCSVQQIYLFRNGQEEVKRFFATQEGRWKLAAIVRSECDKALATPRFRSIVDGSPASAVLIFFEVNNPKKMTEEQRQLDRDLSHTHPALRYMFWIKRGGRPLAYRYEQPALSIDQQPATYLDLFVMRLEAPGDPGEAIAAVPGRLIAAHLRAFIMISVLKGEAGPAVEQAAAETLEALAGRRSIRVLEPTDPLLLLIKTDYLRLVGRAIGSAREDASDRVRRAADLMITIVTRLEAYNSKYGAFLFWVALGGGIAGFSPTSFGLDKIPIRVMGQVFSVADVFRVSAVLALGAGLVLRQSARLMSRRRDQRFWFLSNELSRTWAAPEENVLERHERLKVMVRERWVDAFRSVPLDFLCRPEQRKAMTALLEFVATEAFRFRAKDAREKREIKALDNALHAFPPGVQQSRYDVDGMACSWITCVLPVSDGFAMALLSGKMADADTEIDREIDRELADRLQSSETLETGETVSFVLMHVVDHDLQGFDPGELHHRPAFLFDSAREAGRKPFRRFPLRHTEAEVACGRILAVMDHLARLLGRFAESGHIIGGLSCRCRIIIRVDSTYQAEFLRQLGFKSRMRMAVPGGPLGQVASATDEFLGIELEPGTGAFLALPPPTRAFVGLLNEMSERYAPLAKVTLG